MNNNSMGPPMSPQELQRRAGSGQARQTSQGRNMGMMDMSAGARQPDGTIGDMSMQGGDSLDEIISQNNELRRRGSLPQSFNSMQAAQDSANRRVSMLDYVQVPGNPAGADFQFENMGAPNGMHGTNDPMVGGYGGMSMSAQSGPFTSSAMMAMADGSNMFNMTPDMIGFSNLSMAQMSNPSMDFFGAGGMAGQMAGQMAATGPINHDFNMGMKFENTAFGTAVNNATGNMGMAGDGDMIMIDQPYHQAESSVSMTPKASMALEAAMDSYQSPLGAAVTPDVAANGGYPSPVLGPSGQQQQTQPQAQIPTQTQTQQQLQQSQSQKQQQQTQSPAQSQASGPQQSTGQFNENTTPAALRNRSMSATDTPTSGATPAKVQAAIGNPRPERSLYSKSGFDMMRALWYVVSRKNPEVQLGAVDMSCAFVVCDMKLNDCPIIYVSDNFQNLTGYSRHEIIGKNCRFLQAPDGKVEAGTQREFVENDAIYRLKRKVAEGREIQQSLINYRKGGKPFLNLLTMIPIPWDSEEIRYFIGFQIDLVECPDAITGNDKGGAMQVNYIHSDLEQYIWQPPTASQWGPESGQTLAIDDVSTLLQQFNPTSAVASEWHRQSWDKMLLENSDDVVHVLSLKGLFLYLSPSCKRVLEWDTAELVGTSLADICHPSDIIPATRELKDTGAGGTVDIAFRIRRKHSGYMWFESHGSLFVEQGKGRKCVILVGRQRPIYNLSRAALEAHGGIGDSEIWTKLSTSGMFLFVSSNVRSLLDLLPQSLVGTSMQEIMRRESRPEFGRAIERVRLGKIAICKHEVQNKRGQVLQAETALFPGDVPEGQKPTFILAKTRLLKASSRSVSSASRAGATSAASMTSDGHGRYTSSGDKIDLRPRVVGDASSTPVSRDDDNIFGEFGTTKTSSWQYELRQMEKDNRRMAEDLALLLSNKKKRKRRKGGGNMVRDCANCHTRNTPEWRRGPSGNRDLCNSCGLRWAKQTGRVSPRTSSRGGGNDAQSRQSNSPHHSSPLQRDTTGEGLSNKIFDGANVKTESAGQGDGSETPGASMAQAHGPGTGNPNLNPPPSQPMLEGGSGSGGAAMEMEAIREERETSA